LLDALVAQATSPKRWCPRDLRAFSRTGLFHMSNRNIWGPETFRVRAAKTPTCTFGWTGRVGDRIRTDLCLEFSDTREQAVEEDWLKQWATRKFRRAARLPELDGPAPAGAGVSKSVRPAPGPTHRSDGRAADSVRPSHGPVPWCSCCRRYAVLRSGDCRMVGAADAQTSTSAASI
jgi:hypothetical protein